MMKKMIDFIRRVAIRPALLALVLATAFVAECAAFSGVAKTTDGDNVALNRVVFDGNSLIIKDGRCVNSGWIDTLDNASITSPEVPGHNVPPSFLLARILESVPFSADFQDCGRVQLTCKSYPGGHQGGTVLVCRGTWRGVADGRDVNLEYWLTD